MSESEPSPPPGRLCSDSEDGPKRSARYSRFSRSSRRWRRSSRIRSTSSGDVSSFRRFFPDIVHGVGARMHSIFDSKRTSRKIERNVRF